MKGKLTKLMMVAMMLATVFGLAASLATVSSTATVSAATDKWSRMDLPTTHNYQMFPDSTIWDLTGADDGTLFALVEDNTGLNQSDLGAITVNDWDGLRWAIYPAYSDYSLFKSTNGGCSWELCWHVPSAEMNAPVAVVPQPGYVDTDSSNDTVFVALGSRYLQGAGQKVGTVIGALGNGSIYRSIDGCDSFKKVTQECPGVSAGGTITALDVVQCEVCSSGCQDRNIAIVGVSSLGTSTNATLAKGEGVYTWNEMGLGQWNDLQISNSMQAPPQPGTMPAGNGLDVLAVHGSRNYTTDGLIVAVVNDLYATDPAGEVAGVYTCFYDGNDGYWGGDPDSPTNAFKAGTQPAGWVGENAGAACIATGTDFNKVTSCNVFVGLEGCTDLDGLNNDVWRVLGLSTVTGPSRVSSCNVQPLLLSTSPTAIRISDVMVNGAVSDSPVYVGCEYPQRQAQQLAISGAVVWPNPVPSFKPTSGGWPVFITEAAGTVYAGSGSAKNLSLSAYTTGGMAKMYSTSRGTAFNGRGLLDDIACSEDIPGNTGSYALTNTDWFMVEAVSQEVSPTYNTDGLIYVATWSEWTDDLSLWRLTDGCWERIMQEDIRIPGGYRFEAKQIETTACQWLFANTAFNGHDGEIWWPKVVPQFSTDQSMFLLGGRNNWTTSPASYVEMLWYSPDKGNDWKAVPQMPIGAAGYAWSVSSLSESGWCVIDSNHILLGDVSGMIYRTDTRGASWTEGVSTSSDAQVNTIVVSPIYSSAAGVSGTDQVVLAGTFSPSAAYDEVWISQDGCYSKDLENVGDEIYTSPSFWQGTVNNSSQYMPNIGGTVVNFDKNWAGNKVVYAAGGGWMDRWELVGTGSSGAIALNRIDYTDTSVVRTVVDLVDPAAATWEHLWDADDYNAISPTPQVLTGMALGNSVFRMAIPSAIQIGADGTVYVTFSVWDSSYNNGTPWSIGTGDNPSPQEVTGLLTNEGGRFTMAGILRCLDGAAKDAEFENCMDGRGPWDGLWLNAAVPGSTQLISLTWDWKEWDWKLAFWKDTLSGTGPAASGPANGATGVGSIMADTSISAPVSWQAQTSATLYEWQVSEDAAFSNPKSGTTSATTVTVSGLQAQTNYYWRVRAVEPMLGRWSTVQAFTTVPGGDTGAPKAGKPEDGATITDTTPLFTWAKIASATNYELQVATNPGFGNSDIVINKTNLGDVSAFEADKELVNGTYYWRVRGTNPATDTESPWSFGSFTLDTDADSQSIPPWVWVLIIVGVVLAIIVLVLILRTRRPV